MHNTAKWWQTAVIYQVYIRSFQDSNDDGIGDIPGITSRLDYLLDLGVDAIWINPFYKSPMADCGYDVSDHCAVDPIFGSLEDFDALILECKKRNIKVILDIVPNHTSSAHPWFTDSVSGEKSSKRNWYVWRAPGKDGGPPNNWQSFFGGPAWTLSPTTNEYYLHHFLPEQPDLNYREPLVVDAMLSVMDFWFQRGVDGFRLDAVWLLVENSSFANEPENPHYKSSDPDRDRFVHIYTDDQPETHAIMKRMRRLADDYSSDGAERVLIGEIYLPYPKLLSYYGDESGNELHLPCNFKLITDALSDWRAPVLHAIIEEYESSISKDQWPNWVLGNHDRTRIASYLGPEMARTAMMLLLTLRGTPTIYFGDELGLPDGKIDSENDKDPCAQNGGAVTASRSPARAPMLWTKEAFGGFSRVEPWLPSYKNSEHLSVEHQLRDTGSMLSLTKSILKLRRQEPALSHGALILGERHKRLLVFERSYGKRRLKIALNFSEEPVEQICAGRLIFSSNSDTRVNNQLQLLRLAPFEGAIIQSNGETDGSEEHANKRVAPLRHHPTCSVQ